MTDEAEKFKVGDEVICLRKTGTIKEILDRPLGGPFHWIVFHVNGWEYFASAHELEHVNQEEDDE